MAETIIGMGSLMHRLEAVQAVAKSPEAGLLRRLALRTVAEAKRLEAPHRKTGNLGRSIHVGQVSATYAEVVASAGYAAFLEFGTRPHIIRPVKGKALRWAATGGGRRLTGSPRKATLRGANGGVVFAREVHHPGTRPYPYMAPAAQVAIKQSHLEDVIVAAWNGAA